MSGTTYRTDRRTIRTGAAQSGEDEVFVHFNGRRGAVGALELSASIVVGEGFHRTATTRIPLGAFLKALGITAEDCAAALAAEEGR